jgi:hypothetical protein
MGASRIGPIRFIGPISPIHDAPGNFHFSG